MNNNHDRLRNAAGLTGIKLCSPDLKAEALRTSKQDSRERPQLSLGIDPGPAGFAWSELKTLRAGSWKSNRLHSTRKSTMTHPRTGRTRYRAPFS